MFLILKKKFYLIILLLLSLSFISSQFIKEQEKQQLLTKQRYLRNSNSSYDDDFNNYGDVSNPKDFSRYYYSNILDETSPLRIGLYIEGAIYFVFTILQLCIDHRFGEVKLILIYSLWLVIDVVIICSRANFMFNHGQGYEPYRLHDGTLVYFKDALRDLDHYSRKEVGCNYDLHDSEPASDETCSYWFIPFNANLVSQGWVKFSLGVGLIINIVLRICAVGFKLVMESIHRNEGGGGENRSAIEAFCAGVGGWIVVTIVELLLHFQQFIVLLPFEVILPNYYCLDVQVPVSTLAAVCRYKLACAGIPIGVPLIIGGVFFALIGMKGALGEDIENEKNSCCLRCFFASIGICAMILAGFGATMVIFWLFGGIILGFWYVFGAYSLGYLTSEVNLTIVFFSSFTIILLFIEALIRLRFFPTKENVGKATNNGFELVQAVVAP